MNPQAGILEPPPSAGRHLTFDLKHAGNIRAALQRLKSAAPPSCVVGVGAPLAKALGASIEGLRSFPSLPGCGLQPPSTQSALWVFVREQSTSECFDTARMLERELIADFALVEEVGTFVYRGGHDLSGYEDGTENPRGADAVAAAIVAAGPLQGSSFAAVQRWLHDLTGFQALSALERDHTIGRALQGNDELPDAPVSAHVKRSAQESYDPPAYMVRRSMPWSEGGEHGLYFLAFGESLDRFERVLTRMIGAEDGVVDGLFGFTRPVTGGYYWCPGQSEGHLNLSPLGL